eukprot:12122_1
MSALQGGFTIPETIVPTSILSVLSKKRKMTHESASMPPKKKQKQIQKSESEFQCIFPHQEDQNQYILLSQSIQSTACVVLLNIPTCIIHTIAEYATGIVETCDNNECNTKIVRLLQDIDDASVIDKYYRCNKYEYYYCLECMPQTETCACGEWKLVNQSTVAVCAICSFRMAECTEFCGCEESMISECYECEQTICYRCQKYCQLCQKIVCLDCVDEDQTKYDVLYGCKSCDNSIRAQHANCSGYVQSESNLKRFDFKLCDQRLCLNLICTKCNNHQRFCGMHQVV